VALLPLHRSKLTENYAVTEIISKTSCDSHRSNLFKGFFWGVGVFFLLCNDDKQLRIWNAPVYSHQE